MSKFVAFLKDETGASAAEYVLILAIVGSLLAGGASVFGKALDQSLKDAAVEMKWAPPEAE